MALRKFVMSLCILAAVGAAAVLIPELLRIGDAKRYNAAIFTEDFAAAADYAGDYGLFAQAYAAHQSADFQAAREHYAELLGAEDETLRKVVRFNLANTYLQQAATIDFERDPDLGVPLVELAKLGYREVLENDSGYWGAKYNLERALQMVADTRKQGLVDVPGRRRTVRTVVTADPEDTLP